MIIEFENIESPKVKNCFTKVMNKYESLHNCHITLQQGRIKSSTMQAQPVISPKSFFGGIKRYSVKVAIYVRDSQSLKVTELPDDVLTGWFAHELGHIVDYGPYSNFQMIMYGLKYLLSDSFKKKAEHEADLIALKHGFRNEILATKRFLLENEQLGESYRTKLNKYYMSIADVEMCADNNILENTILEL